MTGFHKSRTNTIHLPDPVRSRRCECDRPIHDAGSCIRCGRDIPLEVLARAGLVSFDVLEEATAE